MPIRLYRLYYWLRCIWHDLFGHPTALLHDDRCRRCRFNKAICTVCWHHYTLNLQGGTDA